MDAAEVDERLEFAEQDLDLALGVDGFHNLDEVLPTRKIILYSEDLLAWLEVHQRVPAEAPVAGLAIRKRQHL